MHLHRLRTRSLSSAPGGGSTGGTGPMSKEQTLDVVAAALRSLPTTGMHDMAMTPTRNLRG